MGNACSGPEAARREQQDRRREAALSLGTVRDGGAPAAAPAGGALMAQPYMGGGEDAQMRLAMQQSAEEASWRQGAARGGAEQQLVPHGAAAAGRVVAAPGADDDAALRAALAASEEEAARQRLREADHDDELQLALSRSRADLGMDAAEPTAIVTAVQPEPQAAAEMNPFGDDPFFDAPQPQPQPQPQGQPTPFDALASLREVPASAPKKSPNKSPNQMKETGDLIFNEMAAPLQQALECIGAATGRDFSEYTTGADDFERGANLMNFVSFGARHSPFAIRAPLAPAPAPADLAWAGRAVRRDAAVPLCQRALPRRCRRGR